MLRFVVSEAYEAYALSVSRCVSRKILIFHPIPTGKTWEVFVVEGSVRIRTATTGVRVQTANRRNDKLASEFCSAPVP